MSLDKPKIAFVVPYRFTPGRNGGQKAALGLAEFLHKNTEFFCISTRDNPQGLNNFNLIPLLSRYPLKYFNLFSWFPIYKTLKKEIPDFCLVHQHFIFFIMWPVCRLLKIPLGIYVQNIEYQRFKSINKFYWPVVFISEWMSFKWADHLFFISPDDVAVACDVYGIGAARCSELPYGIKHDKPVHFNRRHIRKNLGFQDDEILIIFFGPLSYQPNLEALDTLLNHIEPALRKSSPAFKYKFIICGGSLPEKYNNLDSHDHFVYKGYVEDIESYICCSDMMINPVFAGGGVKTKIIEAIALGTTVISSKTGTLGVQSNICGDKLVQVDDRNYQGYATEIIEVAARIHKETDAVFYNHYYLDHIVKNFLIQLKQILKNKTK